MRPKPFSGLDDHEPIREATEIAPDPGDQALLSWAVREQRVMVTIDSDFGLLVFRRNKPQTGIERLKREWAEAQKTKKFGLVFDRHLPELVPTPKARPRRGDLVARKGGSLTDLWRVRRVSGSVAHCVRPEGTPGAGDPWELELEELVVVRRFGEPIFPALVPMDQVQNGSADAPWHCLIEADNFHALQLLGYLYAGKVDCIYIDPPYNA